MDEVPMDLAKMFNKQARSIGSNQSPVNFLPVKFDLKKRFGTIVVLVRADGWLGEYENPHRIGFIHRGIFFSPSVVILSLSLFFFLPLFFP
jgi:hypothetical protein